MKRLLQWGAQNLMVSSGGEVLAMQKIRHKYFKKRNYRLLLIYCYLMWNQGILANRAPFFFFLSQVSKTKEWHRYSAQQWWVWGPFGLLHQVMILPTDLHICLPGATGHLAARELPFLYADLSRQMVKIIFYYSENISRQKKRIYSGKLQPCRNPGKWHYLISVAFHKFVL